MTFHARSYRPPQPQEVRDMRNEAGLTQEQAAAAAGVERRSWIRYEVGDALMTRSVYFAFCRAIGKTIDR